jgi:hypothetical protein
VGLLAAGAVGGVRTADAGEGVPDKTTLSVAVAVAVGISAATALAGPEKLTGFKNPMGLFDEIITLPSIRAIRNLWMNRLLTLRPQLMREFVSGPAKFARDLRLPLRKLRHAYSGYGKIGFRQRDRGCAQKN